MLQDYDFFYDEQNNVHQLRTRGVAFAIRFDDEEKKQILEKVIELSKKKKGFSLKQIKKSLTNFPSEKVDSVLHDLKEGGIVYEYETEGPEKKKSLSAGINMLLNGGKPKETLSTDKKVSVFGHGRLLDALKNNLSKDLFKQIKFTDHAKVKLTNSRALEAEIKANDFFIIESDSWNPSFLKKFNKLALKHNKPWLLVFGAFEGQALVGPLFHGKETGCYNCMLSRFKSNIQSFSHFESYESYLEAQNKTSRSDWSPPGFHALVASLVSFEVLKYLTDWDTTEVYGNVVSVNFQLDVTKHKLLKNPLCKVCKPELEYNISPWLDKVTLSSNEN